MVTGTLNFKDLVGEAERRIRPYVPETPVVRSARLSEQLSAEVFFKLENLQISGSFKARGAFNRILSLPQDERSHGIVAASSGNHGAAIAYSARRLGEEAIVFVPESTAPLKVQNIKRLGASVRVYGAEGGATEVYARQFARDHNMVYISPYNDPLVIAGQGTIASELLRQLPTVDAVVASVGGGGLIAGIAGRLKAQKTVLAIGVSPCNSMAMAASLQSGHIVETEHLPTLSDGTAGGLEPGAITFDLCRQLIDEMVVVTEDEIASALRLFIETEHLLCEGAAAAAVAGLLRSANSVRGKTVAVIICGANISADTLKAAL